MSSAGPDIRTESPDVRSALSRDLPAARAPRDLRPRGRHRPHGARTPWPLPDERRLFAQALAGGALLGALQKKGRVNLQLECDGPLAGLFVDADTDGNVRGYVRRPNVHFPGDPGRGARAALGGSGSCPSSARSATASTTGRDRAPRARSRGRPPALVRRERAGGDRARPRGGAQRRRAARGGRRRARATASGRRRRRDRRGGRTARRRRARGGGRPRGVGPGRAARGVRRGLQAARGRRGRLSAAAATRARGRPSRRSGATVLEVLATDREGDDRKVLPIAATSSTRTRSARSHAGWRRARRAGERG